MVARKLAADLRAAGHFDVWLDFDRKPFNVRFQLMAQLHQLYHHFGAPSSVGMKKPGPADPYWNKSAASGGAVRGD